MTTAENKLSLHQTTSFHSYTPTNPPIHKPIESSDTIDLLASTTINLVETYRGCNPLFNYSSKHNPKRVLTKPSQPVYNHGYDNENYDYILRVHEVLGDNIKHQYRVEDLVGQGTFGQVVKVTHLTTGRKFAIKIVKNKPAYYKQGCVEVRILKKLNTEYDPLDEHSILQMYHYFKFREHLCLVFELLSVNLYELIRQNKFRGLSLNIIRHFMSQIIDSMLTLAEANVVHCDLKPENILLKSLNSPDIKIIDFGSACLEHRTIYTYIQSRFYRSPEVILGVSYGKPIDMWSVGCIAAELFLGLPLFAGCNEYNQLHRIIKMRGHPPSHMLRRGKQTSKFFELAHAVPKQHLRFGSVAVSEYSGRAPKNTRNRLFYMKSYPQYCKENDITLNNPKKYFNFDKLQEIIKHYSYKKGISDQEKLKAQKERDCFFDFIDGLLQIDPAKRLSARQAAKHPFLLNEPWDGKPYAPPPDPLYPLRRKPIGKVERKIPDLDSTDQIVGPKDLDAKTLANLMAAADLQAANARQKTVNSEEQNSVNLSNSSLSTTASDSSPEVPVSNTRS